MIAAIITRETDTEAGLTLIRHAPIYVPLIGDNRERRFTVNALTSRVAYRLFAPRRTDFGHTGLQFNRVATFQEWTQRLKTTSL